MSSTASSPDGGSASAIRPTLLNVMAGDVIQFTDDRLTITADVRRVTFASFPDGVAVMIWAVPRDDPPEFYADGWTVHIVLMPNDERTRVRWRRGEEDVGVTRPLYDLNIIHE